MESSSLQTELGGVHGAVRTYGTAASALGYSHLAAYDHVVQAMGGIMSATGWPGSPDIRAEMRLKGMPATG